MKKWDTRYPLVRDASKCVKCMRCIQVCDKIQGMHIWDVSGTGARTTVGVSENRDIKTADCALLFIIIMNPRQICSVIQ